MFYRITDKEFINVDNIKKIIPNNIYYDYWDIVMIDGEKIPIHNSIKEYMLKKVGIFNPKPNKENKDE